MNRRRIVITGMSVISSLGDDVELFYQALLAGKSGIKSIDTFPCEDYPTRFAGVIDAYDPGEYLDKKQARRVDPYITYTIVAGKKALEMGRLDTSAVDLTRCGVVIGSGMGGMSVFCDGVNTLDHKGVKRVSPFFVPYILTNMGGALLAKECGFMGPNYSISTACATGNNSIISAANHLRYGDADVMLCGGMEAAVIPMGLAGFSACKALSQRNDAPEKASRPWDKERDGFVMGEGGGVLLLETLEHALKRGAPILAEYLGHGLSCDAYHMTEPHPEGKGVEICIRSALSDAGVTAEEVDYINAHATSTPVGDIAEIRAMKKVFTSPERVSVNGTKSMIGHLLGGAAGAEAVVTVKSITDGIIHPTINLDHPEDELTFHAPTKAFKKEVNVAISNSFGFGGHNATIVIGKYRA